MMSFGKCLLPFFALCAMAFFGCRDSAEKTAKVVDVECPSSYSYPADADGEFDPVASESAIPCGSIRLWGASMPKSFNMWEDYNSFSAGLMNLMFEPLVSLHSTEDRPIGILADRWEISADSLTFTFHIDPRAKWSDGVQITAEDVQFYYDVIMDPKNLTPIFKVGLSRFDRPKILDSLTVSISAKTVHWANFWEAAGLVAFPKHVWNGKDFNQVRYSFPVVEGPYRITDFREDRYVELSRNADWWGFHKNWNRGKYNFEKIRYRFMEDRTKALEAFKKGDLDAYAVYTSSIWMKQTDFSAVQKGWAVKQRIYNREPIGFQGMAMNLRREKFQDVRVRKALSYLMDRKLMNEKYMYDQYFLLNSYYPDLWKDHANPQAENYPFDMDRARKLLSESGYVPGDKGMLEKDGKPLEISFITASEDLRHLTFYQEALQKAGIRVSIEQMSQSTLRKRLDNADFDMYWIAWGSSRLSDPEASWSSETANDIGTNNVTGVADPVVDSLVKLQKTEFDMAKRNEILRALDNRLSEIVPYVLMWQCDFHRILYWNRFGTPTNVYTKFGREDESVPVYWWFSPEKSRRLDSAMKAGTSLPREREEVRDAE